jgi:hypothetical protein
MSLYLGFWPHGQSRPTEGAALWQISSGPADIRDVSKLVNFTNHLKEARRGSHNAQDVTVWGEL